jgi:hypothetical protein
MISLQNLNTLLAPVTNIVHELTIERNGSAITFIHKEPSYAVLEESQKDMNDSSDEPDNVTRAIILVVGVFCRTITGLKVGGETVELDSEIVDDNGESMLTRDYFMHLILNDFSLSLALEVATLYMPYLSTSDNKDNGKDSSDLIKIAKAQEQVQMAKNAAALNKKAMQDELAATFNIDSLSNLTEAAKKEISEKSHQSVSENLKG